MKRKVLVSASTRAKQHTRSVGKSVAVKNELGKLNEYKPEKSSLIHHVKHDPKTKTMVITFHNQQQYSYSGVSSNVFHGLKKAKSAGKYFHKNIRSSYETKKL
jgi:hypothetical protein